MTLRLIHTADWQIGKPFRNFPAGLSGELAAARLDAVHRIAAIARERQAAAVLVAGDVFDSEHLALIEVRRALERLASESGVTWLLLPGNHDPARAGGIWDRIRGIGLPANVVALTEARPYSLGGSAILLPAPLMSKNPGFDPTAWMDGESSAPAVARIGLAHGSVQGFGSEGDSSVAIARDRAQTAGLTYLALGDWHGLRGIARDTWYSGTPEPDRFPDNEPGSVIVLEVENARLVSVDSVKCGAFTWGKVALGMQSAADLATLERAITRIAATPRATLLRVALQGSLSLADRSALAQWIEIWSSRLRHLEIDDTALIVRPDTVDYEAFAASRALSEALRRVASQATGAAGPDRAVAETALMHLHGFALEALREAAS